MHRLDECEKLRKYKAWSLLGPNAPSFDPNKSKLLINKAIEIEVATKECNKEFKLVLLIFLGLIQRSISCEKSRRRYLLLKRAMLKI